VQDSIEIKKVLEDLRTPYTFLANRTGFARNNLTELADGFLIEEMPFGGTFAYPASATSIKTITLEKGDVFQLPCMQVLVRLSLDQKDLLDLDAVEQQFLQIVDAFLSVEDRVYKHCLNFIDPGVVTVTDLTFSSYSALQNSVKKKGLDGSAMFGLNAYKSMQNSSEWDENVRFESSVNQALFGTVAYAPNAVIRTDLDRNKSALILEDDDVYAVSNPGAHGFYYINPIQVSEHDNHYVMHFSYGLMVATNSVAHWRFNPSK
jgi:hypothetical protein